MLRYNKSLERCRRDVVDSRIKNVSDNTGDTLVCGVAVEEVQLWWDHPITQGS